MKDKKKKGGFTETAYKSVKRCSPNPADGLTAEQVLQRTEAGAVNTHSHGLTPTVSHIIIKNTFTLFNIIYAFLAVIIIRVGRPENLVFLGIVFANMLMGVIQELRAKRSLDKLSVLARARVDVVRGGREMSVDQDEIVLDDIVLLTAGNQVCADAVVVDSDLLETDESLLTGESDKIRKADGDRVLSGSYVTGGRGYVRVTAVGDGSYAHSLTSEAKKSKKQAPKLLRTLNLIIFILAIIIIPLGTALFCVKYFLHNTPIEDAVLGASASALGMIPAGLILLTGVTMTVGAIKLVRRKALVQALPSIETLARADVLCLDKTGTITDGRLVFERLEVFDDIPEDTDKLIISELMGALEDTNATANALTDAFGKTENWEVLTVVHFSSERKWSGAAFTDKGSFILGAPNIIFANHEGAFLDRANEAAAEGQRVLCLAYSAQPITDERLPDELRCAALLILSDHIREKAAETFGYFAREDVTLKVISGDNPRTVSAIAGSAGLAGHVRAIDMSTVKKDADYAAIAEEYTVFGHVTPRQKRELVRGLKKSGHTVCMTGDGVNDILAMRESDCSVAMVGGSGAARSACDFVLLSDDFGVMVDVLKEGRRVINNIERVASIFLLKTIYSVILTLIYIFIAYPYPITPLQMMPIEYLTIGIPSFFIALQANYARPSSQMASNVLEHTLPAAITVVFNTLYIQLAGILFGIPAAEISTMIVFLCGIMGFFLLLQVAKPYTVHIKVMLALLAAGFVVSFFVFGNLFRLHGLLGKNMFFYLPLVYFTYQAHGFLGRICGKALDAYRILKAAGWMNKKLSAYR